MNKLWWVVAFALLCGGCSEDGAQAGREQEIQKMIATLERQIEEYKAKGRDDLGELERLKSELEEELTRVRKKG